MLSLGNDVIFTEILLRLPLKSLMQFKCVSKSFKTIISSSEFVKLYLCHNSDTSDTSDLLILPGDNCISCYDIGSSTATETFTWYDSALAIVVGSTCGLLCIRSPASDRHFSILNPVTRMRLDLNYSGDIKGSHSNTGFAFDPLTLDFKIVSVDETDYPIRTRITNVYSLSTRSLIKLELPCPEDTIKGRHDGSVVINKHLLHWTFWKSSLRKWRIGCFDIRINNWVDDVLLPHCYYDPTLKNFLLDIGVLGECLFSSFENRVESCYDVWVMNEYGVQDSWVKVFAIPVSDDLQPGVVPVAYHGGSCEILIRQRRSSRLFLYNRLDGRLTETKFDGAPNFSEFETVWMCSKSQVDIPGGQLYPGVM